MGHMRTTDEVLRDKKLDEISRKLDDIKRESEGPTLGETLATGFDNYVESKKMTREELNERRRKRGYTEANCIAHDVFGYGLVAIGLIMFLSGLFSNNVINMWIGIGIMVVGGYIIRN